MQLPSGNLLVDPDDVDAMARSLADTDFEQFDSHRIAAHARAFSKGAFQQRLREEVESCEVQELGAQSYAEPVASA